jgi:membrane protein
MERKRGTSGDDAEVDFTFMSSIFKKYFHFLTSTWNRFWIDDCYSKASALSYYTLLSIVPLLAVVFGIGKGFGFDKALENQILETFYQNKEFAEKIITFAKSTLEQAKGGLIAGVGVLVLFWSAIGLLGSFESALNAIWKIPFARTFWKKMTDFLPLLVFCPIFIVASSSLGFITITKVVELTSKQGLYFKPVINLAYLSLLIILTWVFFSFLYIYMPNRKVSWKASIFSGFFIALAFQSIQWCYIHFQIYLTTYNAIYGSFAAIPLFLLWLQFSWIITLAGAEIAAQYGLSTPDFEKGESKLASVSEKELMLLAIMAACEGFLNKKLLSGSGELANLLAIDRPLAEETLNRCCQTGLLLVSQDAKGNFLYTPSSDPETLTMEDVELAFLATESNFFHIPPSPYLDKVTSALKTWEEEQKKLPANLSIKALLRS